MNIFENKHSVVISTTSTKGLEEGLSFCDAHLHGGGTGDTELIVAVCCDIGKRKHKVLPGCDTSLSRFGSLVFVFCGALTQLKHKNTRTYRAAEAKAADELGGDVQCCTAGLDWEGRQNRSFLSQSWVIPSTSLHCLCCLFQKALCSHFLLKVMVPAACFKLTAFSCYVTLNIFYCFC